MLKLVWWEKHGAVLSQGAVEAKEKAEGRKQAGGPPTSNPSPKAEPGDPRAGRLVGLGSSLSSGFD